MNILILSGPSGSGKSTLAKKLSEENPLYKISVSLTTRAKRPSEINGLDYIFTSKDDFNEMLKNNELLEATQIYGNFYGTHKDILSSENKLTIFDIDYPGMKNISSYCKENPSNFKILSIYIMPPSYEELKKRLINRGDLEPSISNRLSKYQDEIQYSNLYDKVIVNNNLSDALDQIKTAMKEFDIV